MDSVKQFDIVKIRSGKSPIERDIVVVEYPFKIFLNGQNFVTLMCTPTSLEDLTIGFLYSEGIINSINDVSDMKIDVSNNRAYVNTSNEDAYFFSGDDICGKRTVTTACGKQRTVLYNVIDMLGTESDKIKNPISIEQGTVLKLAKEFNKKSDLFLCTGGVHSCALCSKEEILLFEEDVGRHNALDKILGCSIRNNIELKDKIIITSGRISSEMIIKVVKSRISVLVSRSAPTDYAVETARELNLTLVGFARGEKMNVYSNFDKVTTN